MSDFDERYDFHTFCYDTFEQGGSAVQVCPPLLNFHAEAQLDGAALASTEAISVQRRRKVDVIGVRGRTVGCSVKVAIGGIHFERNVAANGCQLFAGRRVILTMFKYEPLSWLRQWVEFNIRYHGIEAALIYCNDMPHMQPQDVLDGLAGIRGLEALGVVSFPFPYGPLSGMWRARFCQFGMLEHARLKYLSDAQGVLWGDIDELVLTSDHRPIFALLDDTDDGYLAFSGKYVSTDKTAEIPVSVEARRFQYFRHVDDQANHGHGVAGKWAVAPGRTGDTQWLTHFLADRASRPHDNRIAMRHFLNMNVGWNADRPTHSLSLAPDALLEQAYRKVGWT